MSPGRRTFLKATASMALPYLIPASAMGNAGTTAPSNRIVMAGIGLGDLPRYKQPEELDDYGDFHRTAPEPK